MISHAITFRLIMGTEMIAFVAIKYCIKWPLTEADQL